MTTFKNRPSKFAVASSVLAAGLLLSGCSNGGSVDSGAKPGLAEASEGSAVYQFENLRVADVDDALPFVSSNSPVTIELSDELKQVVPESKSLAVERFEVTSKAFDTGYCRVDVHISYANGDVGTLRTAESSLRKASIEDANTRLKKTLKEALVSAGQQTSFTEDEAYEQFIDAPEDVKRNIYDIAGVDATSFV